MRTLFSSVVLVLLTACGEGPNNQAVEADKSLKDSGAVMGRYSPPKDGRLTHKQLKLYIAVKKKEAELVAGIDKEKMRRDVATMKSNNATLIESAQAMDALSQLNGTDEQACSLIKCNVAEYRWVEAAVVEAKAGAMLGLNIKEQIVNHGLFVNELRVRLQNEKQPETRRQLEKQLSEMEISMDELRQELEANQVTYEAYEHNRNLLANYSKQILAYEKAIANARMVKYR